MRAFRFADVLPKQVAISIRLTTAFSWCIANIKWHCTRTTMQTKFKFSHNELNLNIFFNKNCNNYKNDTEMTFDTKMRTYGIARNSTHCHHIRNNRLCELLDFLLRTIVNFSTHSIGFMDQYYLSTAVRKWALARNMMMTVWCTN